jgi:preprotein translocase subunit SecA
MAFDVDGVGTSLWPGALRRRLEHDAADAARTGAAISDLALTNQLMLARANLRRACALGQADGGAARLPALAALVRASEVALGITPSGQQLCAALGMHAGFAVELGFVGGRPLAVALCALLHVWSGRHCHIVAASDYLAARDGAAFAPLFALCGVSVGLLGANTPPADAERQYSFDIVYATGRQLLSDFMRDDLLLGGAVSPLRRSLQARKVAGLDQRPVTRGMGVALIDDIEAVLVDEAASPVLISAAGHASVLNEATVAAFTLIASLLAGRDYQLLRLPGWQIEFSEAGHERLERLGMALPAYWQHPQRRYDLVSAALLARDALEPERHYVVQEGRVMLADESVFRLLGGRNWHHGMLQALEVREGLPLSTPPRTVARASLQTFFPRYEQLAGAGSSLAGLAYELKSCYQLPVLSLVEPEQRPAPAPHYAWRDRAAKLDGFIALVERLHVEAVPMLIGAPRTADLAAIGRLLVERGIPFAVADGRDPTADAPTLAASGAPGSVTFITAIAGRNCELPAALAGTGPQSGVRGLLFEHFEARRADRAFFAWSGEGAVFASIDDDVLTRPLPAWATPLRHLVRQSALGDGVQARASRAIIALSQWHAAKHGSWYRRSLALRENQLDEQLAFSGKS